MQSYANCFTRLVLASPRRLALPIAVYPGLALTGGTVRDIVTNPQAQVDAQLALQKRYKTPFVLSAMDLSAEAEAFGCAIHLTETEVPSVTGRLITSLDEESKLAVPRPGDKRTSVYLEAVRRLRAHACETMVIGGCIGPFSLAARLVGVSEALELTMVEPELIQAVLEKSTEFLIGYARAFKAAGAHALLMAEPAAGLLSPRGMSRFSSPYIQRISKEVSDGEFALILHNCAAKTLHLPAILETGLSAFHFGAPMDMAAALAKVAPDVVLCGNLDPAGVFCQLQGAEMGERATGLLSSVSAYRNFVLSSGCDLPPGASLASLDAFYKAANGASMPQI